MAILFNPSPLPLSFPLQSLLFLFNFIMKLSSLSPKRLSRSNKHRSAVSRSDPPSFASSAASSSSDGPSAPTPTSVLPGGDNVSRTQLEALLKTLLGSIQEVASMLSEVDCDKDGCVLLEDLLHRFSEPATGDSSQLLWEAFDVFDTDHDGKIVAEELFNVLTAIGDERGRHGRGRGARGGDGGRGS